MPGAIPCAILAYCHDRQDVQNVIDAAFMIALHQIRRGRAPHLYSTRVRYAREDQRTLPGVERVQSPEEVVAMGRGDCDDLAPYLAACRVVLDGRRDARPVVIDSPGIGYHVVVYYDDGSVEDPSARLGMLSPPSVGASDDDKARRRRRAKAFMERASKLAAAAEKEMPGSAARETLLREAQRHASRAASEARKARTDEHESADAGAEGVRL